MTSESTNERLIELGKELAATESVNEQVAKACGFEWHLLGCRQGCGYTEEYASEVDSQFAPDTDPAAALFALAAYAKNIKGWAELRIGPHPKKDACQVFVCRIWDHRKIGVTEVSDDPCTAICRAIIKAEEKRNGE